MRSVAPAPRLTVAVCTHNRARALTRLLANLSALRRPAGAEVLIVDNASTDETAGTAHRFAAEAPYARVIREERLGLTAARRAAIASARTEWVAFIDDDCEVPPGWLLRAAAFLRAHPLAGAAGGRVSIAWSPDVPSHVRAQEAGFGAQDWAPRALALPPRGHYGLVGAGLLVRREAVFASGWMHRAQLPDRTGTRLGSGGDSELVLLVQKAGFEVWYTPGLRLRHLVPYERCTNAYLSRLHLGFGASQPYLDGLGDSLPSLQVEVKHLVWSAAAWGRQIAGGSREQELDRRLTLLRHVGRLGGRLRMLLSARAPGATASAGAGG